MAQKWLKIGFGAIFPIFRLIYSYFLGEAKTYIFPIFFLFRAGGPKWSLYQANGIAILDLKLFSPEMLRRHTPAKTFPESRLKSDSCELCLLQCTQFARCCVQDTYSGRCFRTIVVYQMITYNYFSFVNDFSCEFTITLCIIIHDEVCFFYLASASPLCISCNYNYIK